MDIEVNGAPVKSMNDLISSQVSTEQTASSAYENFVPANYSGRTSNLDASAEDVYEEVGKFIVQNLQEPVEGTEQNDVFNEIESGVVLAALKRTRGNKQAAANLLGLYRPRLYGMIKRHKLEERI